MPEYMVRLRAHASRATVLGGYYDSRDLRVGDEIPESPRDSMLFFADVPAWVITNIDKDGLLHCSPSPTKDESPRRI